MGELRVMDQQEGDFRVKWDKNDPESVENARQQFDDLVTGRSQRYHAYKIGRLGRRQGQKVTEFDPDAEELLVVPQMAGGC